MKTLSFCEKNVLNQKIKSAEPANIPKIMNDTFILICNTF